MKWPGKNFARDRMKSMGITQSDLVKLLGVSSRGAVNHYFRERNSITVDKFKALADRLHTSMDALYTGEEKPHAAPLNGHSLDREMFTACLHGIEVGLQQTKQHWEPQERINLAFQLHDALKLLNAKPTAAVILPFLRRQA